MGRERADIVMVRQGLAESRTRAQLAIREGRVRIGSDHVVRNPSDLVDPATPLTVTAPSPYVSRGAYKLLPALDRYLPDLRGLVALDLGASTGGFTDLMLQRGAARVYAVDVGHGQLHLKLRQDPRVVCLEGVNARYLEPTQVPEPVAVITADVSFISVAKVLPPAAKRLKPGGWAFVLVKPQFEAGRQAVKKGVVTSAAVRQTCVDDVVRFATTELRWTHVDTVASPIKGPKGNQEFIAVFRAP